MKKSEQQLWTKWFDEQSPVDQRTMALLAIERLVELGEVFLSKKPPTNKIVEGLCWSVDGEDMRIPF